MARNVDGPERHERESETEVLHLSSHTRLIQVLPGHPPADPDRKNSMHQHKEGQAYESRESRYRHEQRPSQGIIRGLVKDRNSWIDPAQAPR